MLTQVYIWLAIWMLSLVLMCFICWRKNQSPTLWLLATMIIGPIALVLLACLPNKEQDDDSGMTASDRKIAAIAESYKNRPRA